MSNVEKFYPANAADHADNVLEQAMGRYRSVLVLGWDRDGEFDARATTDLADGGDVLWLVEVFKHKLMSLGFEA